MYKVTDNESIAPLFKGWDESLIWFCLQDCMGEAYAKEGDVPESAGILVADFCFLAGASDRETAAYKPPARTSDFIIMIPQNEQWEQTIEEVYGDKARKVERYATKKEKDAFDREQLKKIVSRLPVPYELEQIDEEIFTMAKELEWAADLCSQFRDYEDYRKRGIGVAIRKNGELVAGASSYTVYKEGIEIEIDTREDERRKGLALACGAKLILECLERQLYPSWDAQNKGSLELAKKLGYRFDKAYPAYEIIGWYGNE